MLVKKTAKGLHSILYTLINIGMGEGGGAQINFVCECMSKDVHAFFPRALSKIVYQ